MVKNTLMDISFQYPPELMSLLIDTIPRLCRSKMDTLLFLKGAGVPDSLTSDVLQTVQNDRQRINKFQIVRTILTRLNEQGEPALRERREVLKRVVEFDDFTTCWENDRLKAQGLVTQIQKLINVKDSFTRMKEERARERKEKTAKREAELSKKNERIKSIENVKSDLFSLFGEKNAHKRGKQLERILNKLFLIYDISVREDFTLTGESGDGILEQIDGVIELDGHLYFVEMKWWKVPVGVPEIAQHMMRVFTRAESRAIIISASSFTPPAVNSCKEALSQKVVTLCTLEEFVMLLEKQADVLEFLRKKIQQTIIEKTPFPKVEITV